MKPHVVAGIFARGGSKGVPRKNVRPLGGKPLIAWAIEAARASALINRVIVSTDDPEIAEVASRFGAEVPFLRPAELAGDDSPELSAWQHAIRSIDGVVGSRKCDVLVSVPATSPLREVEDIDACILALLDGDADAVISVRAAERSPYFNMVTMDPAGYVKLVIQPDTDVSRRQDVPAVYDVTTVAYAARPAYVLSARTILQGRVRAVIIPSERALDIDTELDFGIAEYLIGLRTQGGRT
jgi:N-acylneuraminate cytidylyltransferase